MKKLLLLSTLALAIASDGAYAVDFKAKILDADGSEIPMCAADKPNCGLVLTLGKVATTALFTEAQNGQNAPVSPEEKWKRGELGMKISNAGELELNAEDTALIKRLIGATYQPLVVYRAWLLLDPATKTTP